jgi:hypothetical protein
MQYSPVVADSGSEQVFVVKKQDSAHQTDH